MPRLRHLLVPDHSYRQPNSEAAVGDQALDRSIALVDGRTINTAVQPLRGGGWVEVHLDVTEQRRANERIQFLARHDALTSLHNRVVFNEVIEAEVARVERGAVFAVLCIDLDGFKHVNDTLGHSIGDELLKLVAGRLRSVVRSTDTVARLGGDEFAVVQVQIEQPAGARSLAQRIIDTIAVPFEIEGHQIMIGASIGVAVSPWDGLDSQSLMRNADMALYRAKAGGRRTYRFFEASMDAAARERRELELELRRAIANRDFELHYQPLLDLKSDRIVSCEALIRWNHPTKGRIPPDKFIPMAEDLGLIVEIGHWVLLQACEEARNWPADVGVSVNISPVQFKSDRLVDCVQSVLRETGLDPARLELEITEAVLMQDTQRTIRLLRELKILGVRITLDDFGTGYSSLSYLRKFQFDKLKIDRSFVSDITSGNIGRSIVKAVAELAASLGMRTTAEGVELAEQLEFLKSINCDEIQGYLISRPQAAQSIRHALRTQQPTDIAA